MSSNKIKYNNKEKIIDASKELFLEKGIHDVPLENIAKKAKVARKTITNIFKTKSNLAVIVISRLAEQFYLEMEEMTKQTSFLELSGIQQIIQIEKKRAKIYYEHPKLSYMIMELECNMLKQDVDEESIVEYFREIDKIETLFINPIKKGKEDGSVPSSFTNDKIHKLLFFNMGIIMQRLSIFDSNELFDSKIDPYKEMKEQLKILQYVIEKG